MAEIIKHLLCAKYYSNCFTLINSFNSNKYYYYTHFPGGKTEAHKGY